MRAVLDTHTAIWYLGNSSELSNVARTTIEASIRAAQDIYVSVISIIETVYVVERDRLPRAALDRLLSALSDNASGLIVASVDVATAYALQSIPRSAVPDMPDRIIAATALHLGVPLVTRDRRLQAAGITTIW